MLLISIAFIYSTESLSKTFSFPDWLLKSPVFTILIFFPSIVPLLLSNSFNTIFLSEIILPVLETFLAVISPFTEMIPLFKSSSSKVRFSPRIVFPRSKFDNLLLLRFFKADIVPLFLISTASIPSLATIFPLLSTPVIFKLFPWIRLELVNKLLVLNVKFPSPIILPVLSKDIAIKEILFPANKSSLFSIFCELISKSLEL